MSRLVAGFLAILLAATCVLAQTPRSAPSRIVSTSPGITETLFALGLGEKVVGVSTFCRFPEAAARLPKVGTFSRPDPEIIARLRPELVLIHPGPNDVMRQMQRLNVAAITVEQGRLSDMFLSIRTIGRAAGTPERANALVGQIEERLERIRRSVSGRPPTKALIIVGRRPGTLSDIIAASGASYLGDLVAIAGGLNVLNDPSLPQFPRISMEAIVRLAPDVIIDAGDMGDGLDVRDRKAAQSLSLWQRQSTVAAARAGHVHPVVSDAFVVPGPRVVEAAEALAGWLHGGPSR